MCEPEPSLNIEEAVVLPQDIFVDPEPVDVEHELPAATHTAIRPRRLAIPAALLAVSAAVSAVGATEAAPAPPAVVHVVPSPERNPLPPLGSLECPPATARALTAATRLINEPANPDFVKEDNWFRAQVTREEGGLFTVISDQAMHIPIAAPTNIRQLALERTFRVEQDAARKDGVTVFDPTQYLLKMERMNETPAAPFSDYLLTAQEYMRQFGVTVRIGTMEDEGSFGYNFHAPTPADLEGFTAKLNMQSLIEAFSTMPKEYLGIDGLKTIILAVGQRSDAAAYALTGGAHNTIVANTSYNLSPDVYRHENEHLEDAAQCGGVEGMANDPGYTTFNAGNVYGKRANAPDFEDLLSSPEVVKHEAAVFNDELANNVSAACVQQQDINSELAPVSVDTAYARTNDVEDKAELFKYASDPNGWLVVTNPETPRIRAKFTELFARLWQYRPGVAKFFAAIANRELPQNPCSPGYKPDAAVQAGGK